MLIENRLEILSYDRGWPRAFEDEAARIRAALTTQALRIDHHGSTAVARSGGPSRSETISATTPRSPANTNT